MEENRKKEKRKILPKRRNYVFVIFWVKIVRRRIVKHKFLFTKKFLVNKKSNNKESKHNERTHEERTNQEEEEEEVKRKSKENQSFFFLDRNKEIQNNFSKKEIENTENGKMFSRSRMKKQIYSKN